MASESSKCEERREAASHIPNCAAIIRATDRVRDKTDSSNLKGSKYWGERIGFRVTSKEQRCDPEIGEVCPDFEEPDAAGRKYQMWAPVNRRRPF